MKHFNGPFTSSDNKGYTRDVIAANGKAVCTCWYYEHGGDEEKTKETAQEIAAALNSHDELLAALKKLMRFHPEDEAGPMSEEYWTPEYREAITLAKSALAKAEGQPAQPDQTCQIMRPVSLAGQP